MYDTPVSETLKILVVSEDRLLQRQLSRFFELVGYRVLQAAERQSALAAVAAEAPQVLLLDAELAAASDWELCGLLAQRQGATAPFKFLMVEDPDEGQLHEALEAGCDDFLIKPVAYGELLARLRAAARVLEYDRRVAQQGRVDALTGLLSRSAFVGHLRRQLSEHAGAAPRVACVALDVDFFARIKRMHGAAAGDALLQAVAQELNRLRVGSEVLGCLRGDRFCAMLPGASETAAAEWAEAAREALAESAFALDETATTITASFGVAASESAEQPEQLLDRATQALGAAKTSGRNCVVRWSERGEEALRLNATDALFEQTVVRDVMTPCTVFLRPQEPVAEAIELLDRTRLEGVPVVDTKGRLLGICERGSLAEVAEADDARAVREAMTSGIKTFNADESLAALMEYFTREAGSLVVVLAASRPVGIVTCNSLVALSRPVKYDSLSAAGEYRDTSDYLFTPDVRPLECESAV